MSEQHHRTCHLCEAMCGLTLHHEGDRILRVEGDREDPFSQGHICPKGVALQDLHTDPDRLRQPLRRDGDRWIPLGWEEALDEAAQRIQATQRQHGRDAVAVYLGNPNVHNLGNMLFAPFFIQSLRTRNRFSATSVDQLPHHFVSYHCLGHQLLLPVADLDRSDFLLMLGANPAVSQGSLLSAGDIRVRLQGIRDRGGRVVLVDPRATETAKLVDRHHFIRPGGDALLLASMLQLLLARGWESPGRLADFTEGIPALREGLRAFTPERVAPVIGWTPQEILELTRALVEAPRAVVYGRLGVSVQRFGATSQWLILALNLLTGNLDRPGGAMFTRPAVDVIAGVAGQSRPGSYDRWRSRVRGFPEVGGELPVSVLREEISTPGEGQIRALITVAGNPVLSTPAGDQLDEALGELDFMLSLDPYLTATSRRAHLVLPCASPLTRGHYDLIFSALALRNVSRWSSPLWPRPAEERHDWEILLGLERRLGRGQPWSRRLGRWLRGRLGPEGLLDFALRTGPYGGLGGLSLRKLRQHPHGLDLGPLEPCLPQRLGGREPRIRLAPDVLMQDLPRLARALEEPPPALSLIGRRDRRSNNSWMHNSPRLMRGRPRCTLLMHPKDAAERDLQDGSSVIVRSAVGSVEAPLQISEEMMPGVVSLPHGWGHGLQGVRLSVAGQRPGVNANRLTDPSQLDPVSGNAVLSGVPVEVLRLESATPPPG